MALDSTNILEVLLRASADNVASTIMGMVLKQIGVSKLAVVYEDCELVFINIATYEQQRSVENSAKYLK